MGLNATTDVCSFIWPWCGPCWSKSRSEVRNVRGWWTIHDLYEYSVQVFCTGSSPWRRSSKPPLKSWNFRRDVWQTTDLTPPLPTPPPRPHVCFGLLKILLASKLANPRPQVPLNCSSSPWLKQRRKLYRKLRVSQLTPMCRRFKNTGFPLFTNVFLLLVLTKDFFNSLW